jgi:hypothetical protein
MKRRLRLACLFVAAVGVAARADLRTWMYPAEPDVIANTDVLDSTASTPAPGKPVYYVPVSRGYRDFGFPLAGEKVPDPAGVLPVITKILDTQGYKVATPEHAPAIMILYCWGTFHRSPDPYAHSNTVEMLEFLGANKVGVQTDRRSQAFPALSPGLTTMSSDASTLEGFLPHGMYVITFWAFDFSQAMQGVAKVLWKTNISASTRGFSLPEVLPTMLTVSAPLIGRETKRPLRIDVGKHYKPTVEFGPLKVIEEDVKIKEPK